MVKGFHLAFLTTMALANVRILPISTYIYLNYRFWDWGNSHGMNWVVSGSTITCTSVTPALQNSTDHLASIVPALIGGSQWFLGLLRISISLEPVSNRLWKVGLFSFPNYTVTLVKGLGPFGEGLEKG